MASYQSIMSDHSLQPDDRLSPPLSIPVRRLWWGFFGVLGLVATCLLAAIAVALFGMWWSGHHLAPVHIGMSPGEVRAVAGAPLRTVETPSGPCWVYTRWWSSDAEVFFDGANRVRAIVTD